MEKKSKKIKIELDEKISFNYSKPKKIRKFKRNKRYKNKDNSLIFRYFLIILVLLLIISSFLYLFQKKMLINYWFKSSKNNIVEPYIKAQKDFCENNNKYINEKYEKEIILVDAKINELTFKIYIFKAHGFIISAFKTDGAYEITISKYIIEALLFYSSKKHIKNNKDILILDIGANIGWYPSLLGRYGYTILSFEAFEKNNYVAKKNYCYLNKVSNVIIITKGLSSQEKKCQYFTNLNNAGNGMIICNNNNIKSKSLSRLFIEDSEVELTTLKTFMPYLSDKNIALMKIDIEGYEYKALIGGKELITKYHVPFIVLEFSPSFLKEVGSDPREFAQFFVNNGY